MKKKVYDSEIYHIKDYRLEKLIETYLSLNEIELVNKDNKSESNDNIRNYYIDISRFELLTRDEEIELAIRIQNGDLEARNELVSKNLKLVVSIAKKYLNVGVALSDLILEGNPG